MQETSFSNEKRRTQSQGDVCDFDLQLLSAVSLSIHHCGWSSFNVDLITIATDVKKTEFFTDRNFSSTFDCRRMQLSITKRQIISLINMTINIGDLIKISVPYFQLLSSKSPPRPDALPLKAICTQPLPGSHFDTSSKGPSSSKPSKRRNIYFLMHWNLMLMLRFLGKIVLKRVEWN